MVVVTMGSSSTKTEDSPAADDLFILPSRRGINPEDPGFDPEEFLDMLCEQGMAIQREKLREIVARNSEVEYLQRHGLAGRTDVESFRQCVPVVTYSDLEEDIMKLVNGHQEEKRPIFTVEPISQFNISSGTTAGKLKYFPETLRAFEGYKFIGAFRNALVNRCFPGFEGGKYLSLTSAGKQYITPSGIIAGGMSTNFLRNSRFTNRERDPKNEVCSPDVVFLCKDTTQGMYCHLLCALVESTNIVRLHSFFAATMLAGIRALQKHWPEIVEDIRTGTLNEKVTEPELRSEVEKLLMIPNANQASRVERECSKEDWASIIPRLFPNAHFVECVTSGSMYQYVPALQHFAGHLPIVSTYYAASECNLIGVNPNLTCSPKDVTYMLWPESAYYEFIPSEDQNEESDSVKVLEACDLEAGKEYKILLTTVSGLYRYHLGDILRVKSFRKGFPIFEYVRRKGVLLSVNLDKTDEAELQAVMDKASRLLEGTSMELADYTSTVDISSFLGHYVIYWEMANNRNLDEGVLQKCANTIDESFSTVYQQGRKNNSIGPCKLRVLEEGTVDEMRALATTPAQYKLPRFVNTTPLLKLLDARTLLLFQTTRLVVSQQLELPSGL